MTLGCQIEQPVNKSNKYINDHLGHHGVVLLLFRNWRDGKVCHPHTFLFVLLERQNDIGATYVGEFKKKEKGHDLTHLGQIGIPRT